MGRPKKKIQKREKVFNFISKVIDIIKYKIIGDKTGNSEGITISFIAALVSRSTNLQ